MRCRRSSAAASTSRSCRRSSPSGSSNPACGNNIIPDTARLVGTIRTFDDEVQADIHARVKKIAEAVAMGAGATVEVRINKGPPVTANDPALTAKMLPTLERVAPGRVKESELITGAEDFTFFQREVPGSSSSLASRQRQRWGRRPEPLAAVLRRRNGAHHRCSRPDQPGRRLHAIVWDSLIHEAA